MSERSMGVPPAGGRGNIGERRAPSACGTVRNEVSA